MSESDEADETDEDIPAQYPDFPEDAQTEGTLVTIEKAQGGDVASFQRLFERMRPRLEAWVALRLGPHLKSRLDIEDVVQEVQMQAYRSFGRFTPQGADGGFWRWISTIANNRIRDLHDHHFLAQKRSPEREEKLRADLLASQTSASVRAMRQESHELLLVAFQRLSQDYRDVIRLCTFDGLSYRDAADLLGITPENVSARLSRARAKLREEMRAVEKTQDE